MSAFEYRHPYHCPEWQRIDWPHDNDEAEDDVCENLAEDWMDDDDVSENDFETERQIIMDDIEIRHVD